VCEYITLSVSQQPYVDLAIRELVAIAGRKYAFAFSDTAYGGEKVLC
jgi:hypothetical protein